MLYDAFPHVNRKAPFKKSPFHLGIAFFGRGGMLSRWFGAPLKKKNLIWQKKLSQSARFSVGSDSTQPLAAKAADQSLFMISKHTVDLQGIPCPITRKVNLKAKQRKKSFLSTWRQSMPCMWVLEILKVKTACLLRLPCQYYLEAWVPW